MLSAAGFLGRPGMVTGKMVERGNHGQIEGTQILDMTAQIRRTDAYRPRNRRWDSRRILCTFSKEDGVKNSGPERDCPRLPLSTDQLPTGDRGISSLDGGALFARMPAAALNSAGFIRILATSCVNLALGGLRAYR
jgi:hypothetical protein